MRIHIGNHKVDLSHFSIPFKLTYRYLSSCGGFRSNNIFVKELCHFIIQICPTYDNEKRSGRILSEIYIYCHYIIQIREVEI